MKSHVFIGHHKTGSTSIQRHLAVNHQNLTANGYLYPFADLTSILCSKCACTWRNSADHPNPLAERINALISSKNFLEPHNGLAFVMLKEATGLDVPEWHKGLPGSSTEILALVADQIIDSGAHTLLIASEVLANFGKANPDLVQRLLNGLPSDERHLHVLLRRPDDYLQSWYRQELCFGYPRMGSLSQRLRNFYLTSIHYDYRLMMRAWVDSHAFLQQDIRNYREVRNSGGSVNWFLDAVGASAFSKEGQIGSDWENLSLHPAFVNLVRKGNTHLPRKQALDLIRVLKTLGQSDGLAPAKDVELIGADGRQLLCECFDPINRYLGKLVSKPVFFEDVEEMSEQNPIPLPAAEIVAARVALDRLSSQLSPRQFEILEFWALEVGVTRLR